MQNVTAFEELSLIFSSNRLRAYLNHPFCDNESKVVAAYRWNCLLSQSFYPALQTLEITLRNALHKAISVDRSSEQWLLDDFLHPKEVETIKLAQSKLKKHGKSCDIDSLIAELNFGFWTSLFDSRYEHYQKLWPRLLKEVFPHIPNRLRTRHSISKNLNQIRNLRNRIFHFEPIWYWQNLLELHHKIQDILRWLSPITIKYLEPLDNFYLIYQNGLNYYLKL